MERIQYFINILFIITLCLGDFVAYEFFRLIEMPHNESPRPKQYSVFTVRK